MQSAHTIEELRQWRAGCRRDQVRVALVPTMGALHDGHLRLVDAARARADRVVASLFVNPLQFGPGEDFEAYPRDLDADARQLQARGVDLLFAPEPAEIYPRGAATATRVAVPRLSDILCGAARPGHFVGVATVVLKLFNLVQPDVAVFGEKDFQQLSVIRRMVQDLNVAVEVVGVATVREADGLAMSSRNRYLSAAERAAAPALYRVLQQAAAAVGTGAALHTVESRALAALEQAGLRPEYVRVVRAGDLAPPQPGDSDLVMLAAARLGQARLIDNLRVRRAGGDR